MAAACWRCWVRGAHHGRTCRIFCPYSLLMFSSITTKRLRPTVTSGSGPRAQGKDPGATPRSSVCRAPPRQSTQSAPCATSCHTTSGGHTARLQCHMQASWCSCLCENLWHRHPQQHPCCAVSGLTLLLMSKMPCTSVMVYCTGS